MQPLSQRQPRPTPPPPSSSSSSLTQFERTVHHFVSTPQMRHMSVSCASLGDTTVDNQEPSEEFKIRLAGRQGHREVAGILVQKLYGAKGFRTQTSDRPAAEKPGRVTLLVENKEQLPIGTITIGADGADGLMADELYCAELGALRRQRGVRILELTKFAMDRHQGNSKDVLAGLLNVAYIFTKLLGCNWMVIEVNPRHVAFYQTSLGFQCLGPQRTCARVGAPAVLLGLDLAHTAAQIRLFGGGRNASMAGKSLYRYFLDEQQEAELTSRLLRDV